MTYDPYAHNDDDGKDRDDEWTIASNYIADDCTVRCGLCDRRVNANGLCPDCDNARDDFAPPDEDNPERPEPR